MNCMDCGGQIPYGVGWGGGGVCVKCRAERSHKAAKKQAEVSGKVLGSKTAYDPLSAKRRAW